MEESPVHDSEDQQRAMDSFLAQDVERMRDDGNAHFRVGDLEQALWSYSEAIGKSAA